ncbi:hypothetical protein LRP88_13002 [Fusarium phalaenopsidis]
MSRFEVAGVVLGALPLLMGGAKLFKSHLEKCSVWWKFRETFEGMVGSIEDQMIAYRQNVKFLLRPLALSAKTEFSLLNDRPPSLWYDTTTQATLRERIGHDEFAWLISKFRRLDEIVQEVSSLLPIRDGKACLPAPGTVDETTLRLAFSFTNKRKLLNEVAAINASIRGFLETDLHIAQATVLGPAIMAKGRKEACVTRAAPFLELQTQAARLLKVDFSNPDDDGATSSEKSQDRVNVDQVSQLKEQLRSATEFEAGIKAGEEHSVSKLILSTTQAALLHSKPDAETSWQPKKPAKSLKRERTRGADTAPYTSASTSSGQSQPQNQGAVSLSRSHVRFAPTPSRTTQALARPNLGSSPVKIACDFLSDPLPSGRAGYLEDGDKIISLSLDRADQPGAQQRGAEDLEAFYKSVPYLDERIRLGVKLAYTILGLGTSVWFPQGWDGDDILVSLEHPAVPIFTHNCIRLALDRELADVILRCVGIRFSVVPDLGKAEFVHEVLAAVVEPLEDYARKF